MIVSSSSGEMNCPARSPAVQAGNHALPQRASCGSPKHLLLQPMQLISNESIVDREMRAYIIRGGAAADVIVGFGNAHHLAARVRTQQLQPRHSDGIMRDSMGSSAHLQAHLHRATAGLASRRCLRQLTFSHCGTTKQGQSMISMMEYNEALKCSTESSTACSSRNPSSRLPMAAFTAWPAARYVRGARPSPGKR
jgi:hypothetical protein